MPTFIGALLGAALATLGLIAISDAVLYRACPCGCEIR